MCFIRNFISVRYEITHIVIIAIILSSQKAPIPWLPVPSQTSRAWFTLTRSNQLNSELLSKYERTIDTKLVSSYENEIRDYNITNTIITIRIQYTCASV